jgi:hypothetical protein
MPSKRQKIQFDMNETDELIWNKVKELQPKPSRMTIFRAGMLALLNKQADDGK